MREAHISAQQSQAEEDPRVPLAHAHARWTGGAEESALARSQAPLRLIARVRDRATFEALAGVRPVRRGPLSLRYVLDATESTPPRARRVRRRRRGRSSRAKPCPPSSSSGRRGPGRSPGLRRLPVRRRARRCERPIRGPGAVGARAPGRCAEGDSEPLHADDPCSARDAADPSVEGRQHAAPAALSVPSVVLGIRARGARAPRRGAWLLAGRQACGTLSPLA